MAELRSRASDKSADKTSPTSAAASGPNDPKSSEKMPAPNMILVLIKLLVQMFIRMVQTVFVVNPSQSINRSAVMLLIFSVVHMLGNLSFFGGAESFNMYGYLLNINPALKAVEAYLLITFVLHAIMGTYLTWKLKRLHSPTAIKGGPAGIMKSGQLALTGIVLLVFIVLHLKNFKFGPEYAFKSESGTEMRDLYKLELEFFRDWKQVAWYCAAVILLGFHLWSGWSKTIYKMGLEKEYVAPANVLGHMLIWPLTLGFISTPVYAYYLSLQE